MKLILIIFSFLVTFQTFAQNNTIDCLLLQGDYKNAIDKCITSLQTDSLNAELYYKMGIAYQSLQFNDKSLIAYSRATQLTPNNVKYSFALAKQYFQNGKIRWAEPILKQLYESDSLNWSYNYYLAELCLKKENYPKAIHIYSQMLKIDSTNSTILDKIAFCFWKTEKVEEAIQMYKSSLKINDHNLTTLKNLSLIYQKTQKYDFALDCLNKGILYDSTNLDFYEKRGDIFYLKKNYPKAQEDYFKILEQGDAPLPVLRKIGIAFLQNKNYVESEKFLRKVIEENNSDAEVCRYLGLIYNRLKRYQESILFYNNAIELLLPNIEEITSNYNLLAQTYADSSLTNKTLEYYKKSLKLMYNPKVCIAIAIIYDQKQKDYTNAITYYQRFLKGNTNDFDSAYIESVKQRSDFLRKSKKSKTESNLN